MSASGALFHRPTDAGELAGEAATRAVDADARRVARASENLTDLAGPEPFPRNQGKKLAVVRAETPERHSRGVDVDPGSDRLGRRAYLTSETIGQALATTTPALLVGDHTTRSAVEPESGCVIRRDLVEPAPGCEERLGHHIPGVIGSHPPDRVPEHTVIVLLVQGLEALDTGILA
jgi:hypothetical protein